MKRYAVGSTLFLLTMLTLANAAQAQTYTFPMIGITSGQTLQLNLVAFPDGPCSALLGFLNSNGSPIVPTQQVYLTEGQVASFTLNGNSVISSAGQRVEVLPQVAVAQVSVPSTCLANASAEVFDNLLGLTSVAVPGAVGFPPNPAFGTLGVTLFETARLNVVAVPFYLPCVGTLSFADKYGNQLGNSLNVNLSPGQATFLDLPGSTVVTGLGQRAEVHPIVTLSSSPAGNACLASTEIYLNATGSTIVYLSPATI